MSGLAIDIDVAATGDQPLIYRVDKLISKGTLAMLAPAHSYNALGTVGMPAGMAAALPASNLKLENIAWQEAKALLGAGDETSLAHVFHNAFTSTAYAKFEITPLGGIHGMIRQSANAPANQNNAYIQLADLIRDYIYANLSDDYFMSMWAVVTEPNVVAGSDSPVMGIVRSINSTTQYIGYATRSSIKPAGGALIGSLQDPGPNTAGPTYRDFAVNDWTGTHPASGAEILAYLAAWGAPGAFGPFGSADCQSYILYQVLLENLTKSERDYATVSALNHAEFTKAFAPGGRFHGDEWSNPEEVVP